MIQLPKWRGTRKQSLAQDIQSFVHAHVQGRQHFQKDAQTLKGTTTSTGDQMLQTNGIKCTR